MDYAEQIRADLKADIEATADALGFAASTVARKAGHNGLFYKRLCEGIGFDIRTASKMHKALAELRAGIQEGETP